MSHTNDDSREPALAPSDRTEPLIQEPVAVPTPEPFVAAEPPPPIAVDRRAVEEIPAAPEAATPSPSTESGIEPPPSWRSIVGTPRDRYPWAAPLEARETAPPPAGGITGEVPVSGGPPPAPLPGDDTTLGTLGEEPMGGIPREEPAVPPESAAQQPVSPTITLGRIGEELFAWLKTLASAAVYATLIVTFGFQVARVEGQSMAPTLADQDRLIVNKLAYRLGEPQVGDIVMLYYPSNPEKSFVKRIIAEEGDQIRIVNGRVYRNDVAINDDYVPAEFRSHEDYGPQVVPQGYYFVMGDHRNNSSDSRHWGYVPKKYIMGKVQLRWWPLPQARIF